MIYWQALFILVAGVAFGLYLQHDIHKREQRRSYLRIIHAMTPHVYELAGAMKRVGIAAKTAGESMRRFVIVMEQKK